MTNPEPTPLAPCPYCGSATVLLTTTRQKLQAWVVCQACDAKGPWSGVRVDAEEFAIVAWNTRPQVTALNHILATVREALAYIDDDEIFNKLLYAVANVP